LVEYAGILTPRAAVNDSPEGLEIVIPAPRIWPVVVFLGLWLAGWVTGELFALRQILSPSPLPARVFLAVWLTFWTFGGTAALSICVWMIVGHERVRLRPGALTIQREAFGLGPTRVYELDRVRNLRAQAMPPLTEVPGAHGTQATDGTLVVPAEKAKAAMRIIGVRGPGISFTYASRAVHLGLALDPLEAQRVVAQLQARHSFVDGETAA
jgi:hypothetical protein